MFELNVYIECSTCIFTLNVGIECLNRMMNVRHASVIYTFEYSRGKVSIKDVKFKSNTRLFEDNIQMLHEGFEDYHQMFNLID